MLTDDVLVLTDDVVVEEAEVVEELDVDHVG